MLKWGGKDASEVYDANHSSLDILGSIDGYRVGPISDGNADTSAQETEVLQVAHHSGLFKGVEERKLADAAKTAVVSQRSEDPASPNSEQSNYLEVFRLLDSEGTGYITKDQLIEFLHSVGMKVEEAKVVAAGVGPKLTGDEFVRFISEKLS